MREIDGICEIGTPEEILRRLSGDLKQDIRVPFIIFTGVIEKSPLDRDGHARSRRTDNYGQAFANYLEEHDLGTVLDSYPKVSWTGNTLQVWIWHPDYNNLFAHLDKLEGKNT